jgi:hypothetical protein
MAEEICWVANDKSRTEREEKMMSCNDTKNAHRLAMGVFEK